MWTGFGVIRECDQGGVWIDNEPRLEPCQGWSKLPPKVLAPGTRHRVYCKDECALIFVAAEPPWFEGLCKKCGREFDLQPPDSPFRDSRPTVTPTPTELRLLKRLHQTLREQAVHWRLLDGAGYARNCFAYSHNRYNHVHNGSGKPGVRRESRGGVADARAAR